MKNVVLDIETNGLLHEMTQLHSLVLRDVDTGEVMSCAMEPGRGANRPGYAHLDAGLVELANAERVWGHNLIRFDRPALWKLCRFEIPWEKCFDTRVIAELLWTDMKERDYSRAARGLPPLPAKLIGSHSLEAWGLRLGFPKMDFKQGRGDEAFAVWTPEMQTYCEQDTLVTAELVKRILKENISWEAVETEQELAAYLHCQETNGWPFSISKAATLQGQLAARREALAAELASIFPPWVKQLPDFIPARDNKTKGYKKGVPVPRSETIAFNPGSRQQIADRLTTLHGWQPTVFTEGGQARVDEDTLQSLPAETPGRAQLIEYFLVTKRLGQLAEGDNAWLKKAKMNPAVGMECIHGGVKQNGTITGRASHIYPNIAQVPSAKTDKSGNLIWGAESGYGTDCRALFTVPPGWTQVGADVSGLELRLLGSYMGRFDNGAYGKTVCEGRNEDKTDIHSVNASILGLPRSQAKNWFYAFLYGAGNEKLGKMADGDAALGGKLKAKFLRGLPALGHLVNGVKAAADKKKCLTLLDGRTVPVRHAHAALNTLLQGSGAVVCKRWLVRANRRLTAELGPQGWSGNWAALGWIHDEVQLAVRPPHVDLVKQILVEEIRNTGIEFNLRVPLDGEAKAGTDWAACH